jgi:tetratricopeptide (TPR) repeat protein
MERQRRMNEKDQSVRSNSTTQVRKKWIFTFIMIFSPLIFLGIVEMCLRLANYNPDTNSFVTVKLFQGKEYYCINPNMGKDYFASHNVGVPEPYEEVFEVVKSSRTFRVFCLGESTMYGYPYPSNITAPRFLKDRLTTLFPDKHIEVINLGIPAVSSSVVLDIVKKVVDYSPDLIIVYSGHNEFYGTYGVASTEYIGYNKTILDFYLQVRKLKLMSLLREGINHLRALFSNNEAQTRKATFLERMVQDRFLVYGSSKYNKAKELFRQNLVEMTEVASKRNISICFSTLVSNLKDQYPFISLFASGIKKEQREQWERYFQSGVEQEKKGAYDSAVRLFLQAQKIDSMRADLYYHLGTCYRLMESYEQAKTSFIRAKDYDVLRFRASNEFNEIIRGIGSSPNSWVIDLEKSFVEESPHGIPGNELFSEHLHPNVTGYFLMGKTFCRSIAEHDRIAFHNQWDWSLNRQDEEYHRMAAYTELDVESANIRVKILTSAWPFQAEAAQFTFTPSTYLQQMAFAYCRREVAWEEAHYKMAKYFQELEQYDRAAKEYESVAKELYLFYHPRMLLGDMKILQGEFKEAEDAYVQAFNLDPNQFVRMRLGTLYMQKGKIDEAIPQLIAALAVDRDISSSLKFSQDAKVTTLLTLGSAYCTKGENALAADAFRQVLEVDPNNHQAQAFLYQINRAGR